MPREKKQTLARVLGDNQCRRGFTLNPRLSLGKLLRGSYTLGLSTIFLNEILTAAKQLLPEFFDSNVNVYALAASTDIILVLRVDKN